MSKVIKQAVVLAGGRGTRLMPLTASCPKPMVRVNGKPFLQVVLDQLIEFGITEAVLLTGYCGEQISSYFGSAYKSLSLTYSQQDEHADTAQRVWSARALYDPCFLLLYSDNYTRFDYLQHVENWPQSSAMQLLVHPKSPGNLVVHENQIIRYDNSRRDPAAAFVELGFMLIDWKLLSPCISGESINFNEVIVNAINKGIATATCTNPPYFSISDPKRLQLTERYLQPKRLILIDRDGTINKKAPRGEYIYRWEDFSFIPETFNAMKRLSEAGFTFVIITNQAGIARGVYSHSDVDRLHEKMCAVLAQEGITVADVYLCPHHWDEDCECRKPKAGMFWRCEREHQADMRRLLYIGDDPRDMVAANNAGAHGLYLTNEKNLAVDASLGQCCNLEEAVEDIIRFYEAQLTR